MALATGKYQLLDPLSPEDFKALEQDILERGVMHAIEFDEDGNVIDGHHRKMICDKHGITDYPSIVRKGWSEEQKRRHARRMNLARRQLTPAQKRKLVEDELRETPGSSNRKIAAALGIDHKTVGAARGRLEDGGEIPQQEAVTGINGTQYKTNPTRRSPAPEQEIPVDAAGGPVPKNLVDVLRLAPEFASIGNALTEIKRRMIALAKHSAPIDDHKDAIRRRVEELQAVLLRSYPHAVHFDCGGQGCEKCRGRGYITGGEFPQDKRKMERS